MALKENRYYIIVPEAAVNYIQWPRFENMINDFSTFGVSGMAMSGEKSRRGYNSLKVTTGAVASGVWYEEVLPGPVGIDSVLSLDLWGPAGTNLTLSLCNAAGAVLKSKQLIATGFWNRVAITRDFAGEVTFKVTVDSAQSTSIYLDGLQYEPGVEPTTFFDRFFRSGERNGNPYWGQQDGAGKWRHYRSGRTRSGGRLVNVADFGVVNADFGAGMGPFQQVYTTMANGGAYYQGMRHAPRALTLSIGITGVDSTELYQKRNDLMKLVAPDRFDKKPLIIRYQGFDENGVEATEPIDYYCTLEPSLTNTPELPSVQKDVLNFTVMGGYPKGAYFAGGQFVLDQKFTSNGCVMRDNDGVWVSMDTTGTVGEVEDVALGPDNRIYACGSGGIWKWDGSAWVSLGITFNGRVTAMAFAPNGDLIAGGHFTSVNGFMLIQGITRIKLNFGGTPTAHAIGTGIHSPTVVQIDAIVFDPRGTMYVGGDFEDAGNVPNTRMIAKWDGTVWKALAATPMTGRVRALAMFDQRWMYVGGDFKDFSGLALMDHLLRYDTIANSWLSFTAVSLLDAPVWNIAMRRNGSAVISGGFTKAGTRNCGRVATVQNGFVHPLASGFEATGSPGTYPIRSIASSDHHVFAGSVASVTNLGRNLGVVGEYVSNTWRPIDLRFPPAVTVINKVLALESGELIIAGSWSGELITNGLTKMRQNVFDYEGSAVTYPTITIEGPYTLVSIHNYSTGKVLNFKDLVIHEGESIELGLDPLDLYGKSSWAERGNVLTYLWEGSDIGNFAMEPGENWIGITGTVPSGGEPSAHLTWMDILWGAEGSIRV